MLLPMLSSTSIHLSDLRPWNYDCKGLTLDISAADCLPWPSPPMLQSPLAWVSLWWRASPMADDDFSFEYLCALSCRDGHSLNDTHALVTFLRHD